MIGYTLAIISSIFFSLYIIPRKFTKLDPIYFSLLVGIGFFVSSSLLYLGRFFFGFHEAIQPEILWSILGGVLWAVGLVSLVKSIDTLGLTRSNQWKNLQGPIGVILSLVILNEFAHVNPLWAILAGLCVFWPLFSSMYRMNKKVAHKICEVFLSHYYLRSRLAPLQSSINML